MGNLVSGNAAVARGAIEADVKLVTGYPGTPASDILESINDEGIYVEWSTNEKVALEVALGASILGLRAMVVMKNAGFNVIMDTLTAIAYTGIKGGLVIAVADDPGANFSVTEQDSRGLANYLKLPCLEPSSVQEAKEMAKKAFEISEELELPVIIRTVTRIAQTISSVDFEEKATLNRTTNFDKHYKRPYRWNSYAPPRPVEDHKWLLSTIVKQKSISESSGFNKLMWNNSSTTAITSGIAFPYVSEAFPNINILKLGTPVPIPENLVLETIDKSEKIFVIEEGDSVVEDQIRKITKKKIFSRNKKYGELNVDEIKDSIFL